LDVSNFPQGFFFLSGNRNPLLLVDTGEVAWLEVPDRGLVLVFFFRVAVLYERCRLVNYRRCAFGVASSFVTVARRALAVKAFELVGVGSVVRQSSSIVLRMPLRAHATLVLS